MESLFDDWPADPADPPPPESTWVEMPQERFLSLSPALQLHYCWQRDLDSANAAESDDDARFFLNRASMYEAMLAGVIGAEHKQQSS